MNKTFEFLLSYEEICSGMDFYLYEFYISCEFESRVGYELEVRLIPKGLDESPSIIILGGDFGFERMRYDYGEDGYNPLVDIYIDLRNCLDKCFDYFPNQNLIVREEDGSEFDGYIYFYVHKK